MATLIDPRFAFSEEFFTKFMWTVIEEDFLDFAKTHTDTESNTIVEEAEIEQVDDLDMVTARFSGSSDESISYDIWKPKSPAAISLPSTLSGEDALLKRLQIQLSAFRSIDRPQANVNVFDWWKNNSTQFPDLSKFAKIFLSIPATSISSERLFSKAGLLYSNTLRNRLSAEMAENILIVKANMDKIFLAPSMDVEDEDISSDSELLDDEI